MATRDTQGTATQGGGTRRIDVHHHPSPPSYLAARGEDNRWAPAQRGWSIQKSLEDMERGGVATSVLSLPHSVHTWPVMDGKPDIAEGRRLARDWNEFMARMAADHRGPDGERRFGVFAALPILDIDGSLKEVEHAFDVLKVDGVALMTNIGDRWLGDDHYAPVFEELNRRNAVVYTHPVAPDCCRGILPEFNDSVIEYGTDTTRAIAKLLFTGAAARHPRIRFIFSHAGGTMPFLAERFQRAHQFSKLDLRKNVPDGVVPALNRFYYDSAQAAHPHAMASFRTVIRLSQLLFGTDFPYRTAEDTARGLAECGCLNADELRAVDRDNAVRLMPQFG
jgi:predicted TIM-barrel fold metal-dependent hydrolase